MKNERMRKVVLGIGGLACGLAVAGSLIAAGPSGDAPAAPNGWPGAMAGSMVLSSAQGPVVESEGSTSPSQGFAAEVAAPRTPDVAVAPASNVAPAAPVQVVLTNEQESGGAGESADGPVNDDPEVAEPVVDQSADAPSTSEEEGDPTPEPGTDPGGESSEDHDDELVLEPNDPAPVEVDGDPFEMVLPPWAEVGKEHDWARIGDLCVRHPELCGKGLVEESAPPTSGGCTFGTDGKCEVASDTKILAEVQVEEEPLELRPVTRTSEPLTPILLGR